MKPSILIADRDREDCLGVEWFLSQSSIQCHQMIKSYQADDVLQSIEQYQPEIIILELEMFHHAQFKILATMLEDSFTQVICTSTEATYEQARKALNLQFVHFLLKPYTPNHLYAKVRKATHFIQKHEYIYQQEKTQSSTTSQSGLYEKLFNRKELFPTEYVSIGFFPADKSSISSLYKEITSFFRYEVMDALSLSEMILLFTEKHESNYVKEVTRFLQHWETISDVPLSIVVYEPKSPDKTMYSVFEETKDMGEMIFYHGQRKILSFEEAITWKRMDPFLSPPEQRKWIEMLNKRNIQQIKQELYESFQHVKNPYPDPGLIRTKLTSILAQVRRYMHIYHIQQGEIEEKYAQLYRSILYTPVLYRIVQEMVIFIQLLFNDTKKKHDEAKYDIAEHAFQFIENNYWDASLKLSDVAKAVSLNPAYLSSLLKRKTGHSFKEHLLTIRLQEAHRLLSETALSVKEIAHICGFAEANYFSRCFKEKYEKAPTMFRMQNIDHDMRGK
ncbi:helix-turn-helix domain-containing protein [Bacillus shivajii]|uniref:response regulator transcription factor n=1 Tax=Bacillus shivajii TaxID=1983719 RepID=UPI001CFB177A|nr:response regulator transcription factor [Bacillus shivajii]UCZ54030.1 helix-turn-helix domain-containing protein [Bacillus shivajii]